jgi:hypothetical protein
MKWRLLPSGVPSRVNMQSTWSVVSAPGCTVLTKSATASSHRRRVLVIQRDEAAER